MKLEGAERKILQTIHDLQGESAEYVEDARIAGATRIEVRDVRDWLETLEHKSLIERARGEEGFSAFVNAKGRQALRLYDPLPARPQAPPIAAPSRPPTVAPRRIRGRALIVGVSDYADPIPRLPAVAADVREMAALLGSESGSFRGEEVRVLAERDADRRSILAALEKVFQDADPDDTLFVYLAGHGAVYENRYYFLAHDSKIGHLDTTAVPLASIKELLDKTRSERAFLWLDCCHSGGILVRGDAAAPDDRAVMERTLSVVRGQGKLIMAACGPGQSAYEDPQVGHGLFTDSLLRGLKGEAASAGEVTALSLFDYVDRQMGSDQQRPVLFGHASGRVVLMHYPAAKALDRQSRTVTPENEKARLYTVWYGTNRKPNDPDDPTDGFSAERDDHVHYGTCQVAIPRSHRFGSVGSGWASRWLRWTDDRLKVVSQARMGVEAFWRELATSLQEQDEGERQGIVFLHGYNVTFEEAAIRAAQVGFDLKVPGATAFFSWPSCGTVAGYPADEAAIEASEKQIATFLTDFVARSGASRVHLIAHSMGNRGLLRALQRLGSAVPTTPRVQFGQIVLAAPDIDRDLFIDLAENYERFAQRTTLYVSPADRAVGLSRWVHQSPRVGLTPPVTVFRGVDTVVVPRFDVFELLGHGYFAESEGLLHDIFDLIRRNPAPADRQRLTETTTGDGSTYWVMGR